MATRDTLWQCSIDRGVNAEVPGQEYSDAITLSFIIYYYREILHASPISISFFQVGVGDAAIFTVVNKRGHAD